MAYLCINGWGKECDGCMCCQEDYTEPECDYSKSFNEEVDKLCEAISDDLRALRDLVEEYQSMLKDPDSLILRGSVVVFREHTDEKGPMEYVFFTASGTNSYGAKVTSTVCFANGQFLGSLDEFPSLSEMLEMDAGEATTYTGAKVALSMWQLYGEECRTKYEEVFAAFSIAPDKIARKLHISTAD